MRRPLVVVMVVGALAGCGGKRDVCDPGFGIKFAPVADVWKPYQELFPPEATLCGHMALLGPPNKRAINIDFAEEQDPATKMMAHLEAKGWKRDAAATDNPDTQTIKMVRAGAADGTRAGQTLRATTFRDKGRVRAVVEVEEAACSEGAASAAGGGVCRDKDVVRCEAGTLMFTEVQTCPNGCEVAGGKAACK
jgi:hypothetical protein